MTAIYCRQSVEKEDSISIEQQTERCKALLLPEQEYYVYCDKGYTGANINRPGFEQMMYDIRSGNVEKVICYKVDRLSRSLVDFMNVWEEFKAHNVSFVSCTESFDTSTPMGQATLQIILVFAELERKNIQQRVTDNFYERVKRGFFMAGVAPYAFKKIPTTIDGIKTSMLAIDDENPERAETVKQMYHDYLTYRSLGVLAKALNAKGITTARGNHFTTEAVMRILSNPVYVKADAKIYLYLKSKGAELADPIESYQGVCGCTVYGKRKDKTQKKFKDLTGEIVQLNTHKGLIDSAEWLAVQNELDKNKPFSKAGKGKNTWLTGLTKCAYCGKHISVVGGQVNGKRYVNCGGKKEGYCKGRTRTITFDEIEHLVEKDLMAYMRDFNFQEKELSQKRANAENKITIRLEQIKQEITKYVDMLPKANEALFNEINSRVDALDNERKSLESDLLEIGIAKDRSATLARLQKAVSGWETYSTDDKRKVATELIRAVIVSDDGAEVTYI